MIDPQHLEITLTRQCELRELPRSSYYYKPAGETPLNLELMRIEEVYLKDYETVREAVDGLNRWFRFYNYERLHQSLGYRIPSSIHLTAP